MSLLHTTTSTYHLIEIKKKNLRMFSFDLDIKHFRCRLSKVTNCLNQTKNEENLECYESLTI